MSTDTRTIGADTGASETTIAMVLGCTESTIKRETGTGIEIGTGMTTVVTVTADETTAEAVATATTTTPDAGGTMRTKTKRVTTKKEKGKVDEPIMALLNTILMISPPADLHGL
jgi:hypothetical protein